MGSISHGGELWSSALQGIGFRDTAVTLLEFPYREPCPIQFFLGLQNEMGLGLRVLMFKVCKKGLRALKYT